MTVLAAIGLNLIQTIQIHIEDEEVIILILQQAQLVAVVVTADGEGRLVQVPDDYTSQKRSRIH